MELFPILPITVKDYIIERPLSHGRFGAVFECFSQKYQRKYAIKVQSATDKHAKALFENEVNILFHLNHPNIVKMFDYFTEDDKYYIVLEFCPKTLREEIELLNEDHGNISLAMLEPQCPLPNYHYHVLNKSQQKFNVTPSISSSLTSNTNHNDISRFDSTNVKFDILDSKQSNDSENNISDNEYHKYNNSNMNQQNVTHSSNHHKSKSNGNNDIQKMYDICTQILSAVSYCHSKNICHRDLKPENMLIDEFGRIKLIDFGFSIEVKEEEMVTVYNGSPAYCSPEILKNKPYDPFAADVWTLGVIFYEIFDGSLPWEAGSLEDSIKQAFFEFPSTIPPDVRKVISMMIVVNPKRRIKMDKLALYPMFTPSSGSKLSKSENALSINSKAFVRQGMNVLGLNCRMKLRSSSVFK